MLKMKSSKIITLTCMVLILSSISFCLVPLVSAAPPWVTIDKFGIGEARAGQPFIYIITLTNTGDGTATTVKLNDTLPAGVQYLSSNPSGSYDGGTHTVAWNLPDILGQGTSSVQLTVIVDTDLHGGELLSNTARVTWYDQPGIPYGPNSDTWDTFVVPPPTVGGFVLGGSFIASSYLLLAGLAVALTLVATIMVQRNRSRIQL